METVESSQIDHSVTKDISYHGMMAQKPSIQVCGIKRKEY